MALCRRPEEEKEVSLAGVVSLSRFYRSPSKMSKLASLKDMAVLVRGSPWVKNWVPPKRMLMEKDVF
uniref:Uncharacterized protein n=1 Tax=Knipowitschia caucasica TaxID=637954 RepID=A0AAV2MSA6_KNICA